MANDKNKKFSTGLMKNAQGANTEVPQGQNKEKKAIRFDLRPAVSSDSFLSAKSHDEDEEDDEEFIKALVFNKRKNVFLTHSQPRVVKESYCVKGRDADPSEEILATASSLVLFEVSKASPSPSDVNLQLVQGIYLRQLDAVKRAIKNGADVNASSEGQTPLLIATELGETRIVDYLLSLPKTNVDVQNEFGQTPISSAVRNSKEEIIRLLLYNKADINIPDHLGKYPLHHAVFQQQTKYVKLLLAYGANIEVEDCFGERPIYTTAVKKPDKECLKILLKMGANVNYLNFSGIPLLSRTILNGTDMSVIKMLVAVGASVNLPDLMSRRTPLHFTAIKNNVDVAKFLISRGANPNTVNTLGHTPCDVARMLLNADIVEYLENVTNQIQKKCMFSKKTKKKEKRKGEMGNSILHT